ncbi:MAG: Uma2 family endonuclease [Gammaproteobacteria bacterium]
MPGSLPPVRHHHKVVQPDRYSQPQPDLALLRPGADCYAESHPQPADVLMVAGVAEASLDYDRDVKVPLYARHSIAEAWCWTWPGAA